MIFKVLIKFLTPIMHFNSTLLFAFISFILSIIWLGVGYNRVSCLLIFLQGFCSVYFFDFRLRGVLSENLKSRERLRDITTMLIAKQGENVAEKDCLKFLRKAFPNIGYRRRDNVACVTGVEIKANFRPKEPWLDKAVAW